MKLFLIGTLLFSGGTAAAVQNETVRENMGEAYQNVRQRVQKRFKKQLFEEVKETGFPYPTEEHLATLTEEQSVAILTYIDQVNATYDWVNMTDEEIKDALYSVKEELDALYVELGLEPASDLVKDQIKKRARGIVKERTFDRLVENLKENGLEYPNEDRLANLTEEQAAAIIAKIDEVNATYDWANMTDEEIIEAMTTVKEELSELKEELGIEFPEKGFRHRGPRHEEDVPEEDTTETEGSDVV